jgi:hypothetical protein
MWNSDESVRFDVSSSKAEQNCSFSTKKKNRKNYPIPGIAHLPAIRFQRNPIADNFLASTNVW